jgi:hypothetical protein
MTVLKYIPSQYRSTDPRVLIVGSHFARFYMEPERFHPLIPHQVWYIQVTVRLRSQCVVRTWKTVVMNKEPPYI